MNLKLRPYVGERDWLDIIDIIQSDPIFHHSVDFSWRLCSTSLEDFRNAALWENEKGEVCAFAALQFAWLTFDYAIRPEIRNWEVETQILEWGETRLRQIVQETNEHFPFNVSSFTYEQERVALLEKRGYVRWENFLVVLSQPLNTIPVPNIPKGFVIRSLAGADEVEQYVALHRAAFDSAIMTPSWRLRTLRTPFYNPELDLVAVAPDGRLAGFCVWWYNPQLKTAQIEPLGVSSDFQHLGLSQALMQVGFGRAAALGAERVMVDTYNFNLPTLKAYEVAGFRVVYQINKYYKEY